jgi:hypothetical protein
VLGFAALVCACVFSFSSFYFFFFFLLALTFGNEVMQCSMLSVLSGLGFCSSV